MRELRHNLILTTGIKGFHKVIVKNHVRHTLAILIFHKHDSYHTEYHANINTMKMSSVIKIMSRFINGDAFTNNKNNTNFYGKRRFSTVKWHLPKHKPKNQNVNNPPSRCLCKYTRAHTHNGNTKIKWNSKAKSPLRLYLFSFCYFIFSYSIY